MAVFLNVVFLCVALLSGQAIIEVKSELPLQSFLNAITDNAPMIQADQPKTVSQYFLTVNLLTVLYLYFRMTWLRTIGWNPCSRLQTVRVLEVML